MKKTRIVNRPMSVDSGFYDLMDDISSNLDTKIKDLQDRRWGRLREEE